MWPTPPKSRKTRCVIQLQPQWPPHNNKNPVFKRADFFYLSMLISKSNLQVSKIGGLVVWATCLPITLREAFVYPQCWHQYKQHKPIKYRLSKIYRQYNIARLKLPGAFSPPPTGGSPAQPYHRLNRTKYNILNNYLGFLYLGVTIPNNLFVAFTRFLLVIAIASSSL